MRVEVLGGRKRRRRWSQDNKARIVETLAPGAKVTEVARRNGVAASLVFTWHRQARTSEQVVPSFTPVQIAALADRLRKLRSFCLRLRAEFAPWQPRVLD
ncbi:transposase [Bradyrhizobium sp. IC3123]|nr:transposase [Bradyrhizobium sp. IC3123]